MSYEERHAISTAWIKALEWQIFYERCGETAKAQKWAKRASKLKIQVLSETTNV